MLLDTSGLLCYLNRRDAGHSEARHHFTRAPILLVHNYVLAELVALGMARRYPRSPLLDFVANLPTRSRVVIVWVSPALHEAAVDMLRRQHDKAYSLCDAVSFLVMSDYQINDALSTDHHFAQAGYRPLLERYA